MLSSSFTACHSDHTEETYARRKIVGYNLKNCYAISIIEKRLYMSIIGAVSGEYRYQPFLSVFKKTTNNRNKFTRLKEYKKCLLTEISRGNWNFARKTIPTFSSPLPPPIIRKSGLLYLEDTIMPMWSSRHHHPITMSSTSYQEGSYVLTRLFTSRCFGQGGEREGRRKGEEERGDEEEGEGGGERNDFWSCDKPLLGCYYWWGFHS